MFKHMNFVLKSPLREENSEINSLSHEKDMKEEGMKAFVQVGGQAINRIFKKQRRLMHDPNFKKKLQNDQWRDPMLLKFEVVLEKKEFEKDTKILRFEKKIDIYDFIKTNLFYAHFDLTMVVTFFGSFLNQKKHH